MRPVLEVTAACALGTGLLMAVEPLPELGLVLQSSGLGALLGLAVGVAGRADRATAAAYGSLLGGSLGALYVLADLLLRIS